MGLRKEKFEEFLKLLGAGVSESNASASVGFSDEELAELGSKKDIQREIGQARANFSVDLMTNIHSKIEDNPRLALELLKITHPELKQYDIKLDLVGELLRNQQ